MADKKIEFKIQAKDETGKALDSANKRIGDLEKRLTSLSKMGSSIKNVASSLAAVASFGAMTSLVKGQAEAAAAIGDAAALAGISVESYQRLAFASDNAGGSAELMASSLVSLNKELAKARAGDAKSKKIFADFNVDPATVKDSEDALLRIADAVKAAGDSPEELGKLQGLLGKLKIDPAFVQTLQLGSEGINALGNEAAAAGLVMDSMTVESLGALNDRLETVSKQASALQSVFVSGLAPALMDVTSTFAGTTEGTDLLRSAGERLGNGLKGILIVADLIVAGMGFLGRAFYAIANGSISFVIDKVDLFVTALRQMAATAKGVLSGDFSEVTRLGSAYSKRSQERKQEARDTTSEQFDKAREGMAGAVDRMKRMAAGSTSASAPASPAAAPGKARPLGNSSLAGGGGGGAGRAQKEADELAKAQAALIKAQAEAEANVRLAVEKGLQDRIKDMLAMGEITYADYYTQLVASQQTAVDLRIDALRREQEAEQKILDSSTSSEKARLDARAKLAKITGDIRVKELERAEIADNAAREQRKSEEELAKAMFAVETKTKSILGTLSDADRLRITKESYEAARKEAQRGGFSQAGIDEAIGVETARANFDFYSGKISAARSRLNSQASAIAANTTLTTLQMREQLAGANAAAQASIEALLPALRAQANFLGGEYIDKLRDAETELQVLRNTADVVANDLNADIQSQLSGAISSVMNGDKSPAQALKDLFVGVGSSIGQMIADDLASSLYTMLKSSGMDIGKLISGMMSSGSGASGGGAVSSFGSLISSFFGGAGKKDGGYTGNAGVSTPVDYVHGQEYVLSAPSVRTLGVPFLDALHSATRRGASRLNIGGYADGGFVPTARAPGGGGGVVNNFHITTPSPAAFKSSQGQIEARMGAAAARSQRRNA